MTAPDLSPEQAARVAADETPYMLANTPEEFERVRRVASRSIDAADENAPAAEEALRERVARAIWDSQPARKLLGPWDQQVERDKTPSRRMADAAIEVLRGEAR